MDEDDPFLLSFADALTCVFGAAIALFMIFVVLVKLAPAEVGPAPEPGGDAAMGNALSILVEEGAVDLILMVRSEDCDGVGHLTLENAERSWIARMTQPDGIHEVCERLFEVPPSGLAGPITLRANGILDAPLELRLVAEGTIWPEHDPFVFSDTSGCTAHSPVATISAMARAGEYITSIGCRG